MKFDLNEDKEVVVLLGAGDMGLAIIKRISAGKKILLADINEEKLESLQKDLTYRRIFFFLLFIVFSIFTASIFYFDMIYKCSIFFI